MAKKSVGVAAAEKAASSAVPVHCSFTEMRPLETLVENPRNPNKHSEAQIKLLGRVIAGAGWRSPIVVSKRSGFIVKGHGRFQAALAAGMTHVPVDVQPYATEADEWADMIADNRLAELSEMAGDELKDLLQEMDTGAFAMDLTGYDEAALAAMMGAATPANPALEEGIEYQTQFGVIVICTDAASQESVFNKLTADGHNCKVVVT